MQQCKIMPVSTISLNVFSSKSQVSTEFVRKNIHSPHCTSITGAQSTMTTEWCSKCSCTVTQLVLQQLFFKNCDSIWLFLFPHKSVTAISSELSYISIMVTEVIFKIKEPYSSFIAYMSVGSKPIRTDYN